MQVLSIINRYIDLSDFEAITKIYMLYHDIAYRFLPLWLIGPTYTLATLPTLETENKYF